jgi:hypothetical protein
MEWLQGRNRFPRLGPWVYYIRRGGFDTNHVREGDSSPYRQLEQPMKMEGRINQKGGEK